jgi:uncharacterized membrane protein
MVILMSRDSDDNDKACFLKTTNMINMFAILSHACTSVLGRNYWGVFGAILMFFQNVDAEYLHMDENTATRTLSSVLCAINSIVFTNSILEVQRYNREQLSKKELLKEKSWWALF